MRGWQMMTAVALTARTLFQHVTKYSLTLFRCLFHSLTSLVLALSSKCERFAESSE